MTGLHDHWHAGLRRAREELARDAGRPLSPDEVSVALKYAVLSLLEAHQGGVAAMRRQVRAGELTRQTLVHCALAALPHVLAIAGEELSVSLDLAEHRQARLADFAVDAALSERLSPELLLASAPVRLPDAPVHALVFSAFPHITHELYPLMVDACVAGVGMVVGVHESWLDAQTIRRAILLTDDAQYLLEADLAVSPPIARVQVLGLDLRTEQAMHAELARRLDGIPMANPAVGAALLDDKARTAAIWQAASLATPASVTVADKADDTLVHFVEAHGPHVVVKPVNGTEGRQVTIFDLRQPGQWARMLSTLDHLRHGGGVLLCVERGSARMMTPDGPRRCVVRLNVCWDGTTARVESGYSQVAGTREGIASAGAGGRVCSLAELWSCLCRENGTALMPTSDDWRQVMALAAAGTMALAAALGTDMPALVGLDLLLDAGLDGAIHPVLLEANPRPSGMSHSRFVTDDGPSDEPGVSLHLWKRP